MSANIIPSLTKWMIHIASSFSQILNPSTRDEDVWHLDERILRSSLSGYPRLSSALFPRSANQNLKENPDITLYELLQVMPKLLFTHFSVVFISCM